MTQILFVCIANICRSPMAQSVAESMANSAATRPPVHIESAGTRVARGGLPPDPRAAAALKGRGYALPRRPRSRQIGPSDFGRFDLILAMDSMVLDDLKELCPIGERHKLERFLDFAKGLEGRDVPDPYFGSAAGFENVLDLCEAGTRGLLSKLDLGSLP